MNLVATTEILDGSENFWNAVEYFYDDPKVGLVALRQVLDDEEVAGIASAARVESAYIPYADKPNRATTEAKLYETLTNKGILFSDLDRMNQEYWDPETSLNTTLPSKLLFTKFGESIQPHPDRIFGGRPIGVSLSISIGECMFAAGLPPAELRKKTPTAFRDYDEWAPRALLVTDALDYADLGPGDVAFYMQPGIHMATTSDPDRFGCFHLSGVRGSRTY